MTRSRKWCGTVKIRRLRLLIEVNSILPRSFDLGIRLLWGIKYRYIAISLLKRYLAVWYYRTDESYFFNNPDERKKRDADLLLQKT